jgi:hypothetical protein
MSSDRTQHRRRRTAHRLARTFSYASLAALGVTLAACAPGSDTGTVTSAIHVNPGSTITKSSVPDSTNASDGPFQSVMNFKNNASATCTASIIGPYAVLTANHCAANGFNGNMSINWTDVGDRAVGAVWFNPYLNPAFTPAWWTTLNNQQKQNGGRQDDWPAQHDQVVLFVPALTPEFLTANNLTPMQFGVPVTGTSYTYNTVGVASTGSGASREWVPSRFLTANANTITQSPRDGYFTEDQATANFGSVDPGDSGGPVVGFIKWPWLNGTSVALNRFVVGTAQNTAGDKAPLSYATGTALTPNQALTARLNALFVAAQADDADGDGLPSACDADPAVRNVNDNLCPQEIGTPTGASLATSQASSSTAVPIAQMACKPGYVAVGLRGRAGSLIDQLAVHCRAVAYYGGAPGDDYWTDYFGGDGGGTWSEDCPFPSVLAGINAQTVSTGPTLASLQGLCKNITELWQNLPKQLPWVGGPGTASASAECATGQALMGFQARSYNGRWVTGVQPICSHDPVGYGSTSGPGGYMGGMGGFATDARCPAGFVGTGIVYKPDPSDTSVAFLALECSPRSLVKQGMPVDDSLIWLAHGSAHDFMQNVDVPPMVEPSTQPHLPDDRGLLRSDCPLGYVVSAIDGATSTAHVPTGDVAALTQLFCRQIDMPDGTPPAQVNTPLAVGNPVGATPSFVSCAGEVDGLYVRTGSLTDGVALHCR